MIMKKKNYTTAFLLVSILFISPDVFAGLIDYEKRNQDPPKRSPTDTQIQKNQSKSTQQAIRVTNRSERMYDKNKDGWLQSDELAEYLTDVINTVQRKGDFQVNSDFLGQFDKDEDGHIGYYETINIREYLRQ